VKRPISIYIGVLLLLLRVVTAIGTAIATALAWKSENLTIDDGSGHPLSAGDRELVSAVVLGVVMGVYALVVVIDGLIALFVYRGSNFARFTAMSVSSAIIIGTATAFFAGSQQITLQNGGLVGLSLDILILVSLSSTEARQFSERHRDARLARKAAAKG
jgi:hypothetical protein